MDVDRASAAPSVATAVSNSLSYVLLTNFATLEERCALQESALALQEIYLKEGNEASVFKGIFPNWVSEVSRFSVKELLDAKAKATSDILLQRLLNTLEFGEGNNHDDALADLALQVFGFNSDLQHMEAKWYDEMTYDQISNPEPMVNIYEEGGFFKHHKDGLKMTLLVVLKDAVEGGGTAFYLQDQVTSFDEEKETSK